MIAIFKVTTTSGATYTCDDIDLINDVPYPYANLALHDSDNMVAVSIGHIESVTIEFMERA